MDLPQGPFAPDRYSRSGSLVTPDFLHATRDHGGWIITYRGEHMGSAKKLKAGWRIDAMYGATSGREYEIIKRATELLDAYHSGTMTESDMNHTVRSSSDVYVPPALAAEGITPNMLEILQKGMGAHAGGVPRSGDNLIYDRAYAALRDGGYIVRKQANPGMSGFADYYVLTDKGASVLNRYRVEMRRIGGAREDHVVRDFNTHHDLIEHARKEGASHFSTSPMKLYFPLAGGDYQEADVFKKGGYWHTQAPSARAQVNGLPQGARAINASGARRRDTQAYPAMRASGGRMYNVIAVHRNGDVTQLNSKPLTHQEAVTMASKFTVRKHRRIQLEPVGQEKDHYPPLREGLVRDFEALDPSGRPVAGPFKDYHDAKTEADKARGYVKFVPETDLGNIRPVSVRPPFAAEARRPRGAGRHAAPSPSSETLQRAYGAQRHGQGPRTANSAGAAYAEQQLNGSYFQDWVHDQVAEGEQMRRNDPSSVIDDPRQIAKNMLQQLKWDTQRELDPAEILGADASSADKRAFFEGFAEELHKPAVVNWLADEVSTLESAARGGVAEEAPRVKSPKRAAAARRRRTPRDPKTGHFLSKKKKR